MGKRLFDLGGHLDFKLVHGGAVDGIGLGVTVAEVGHGWEHEQAL